LRDGAKVIRECMNTFAQYDGKRFVVQGVIEDTDYIPEPAMKALGGKYGEERATGSAGTWSRVFRST
jgi:hypothetical protein